MKLILTISVLIHFIYTTTILEFKDTIQNMAKSPYVNLLLIYDTAKQNGKNLEAYIKMIAKNKQDYFKLNLLDCNNADDAIKQIYPYCEDKIRQQLPALIFTQPHLNPPLPNDQYSEPKNHQYQGQLAEKQLYEFAIPLMKAYSHHIKKLPQWNKLTQKYKGKPIILYCAAKDKLAPFYMSLTARFRHKIVFAHIFNSDIEVCKKIHGQQNSITKYPILLLNGKENIKINTDLAKQIQILEEYQAKQDFLILLPEKQEQLPEELTKDNIAELIYNVAENSFVHFNDGTQHPQWKSLKKQHKKMFVYHQSTDENLIKQLGIKKLPALAYFPKSLAKKQIQKTFFSPRATLEQINKEIYQLIQDFTVPLSSDLQMQQLTSISLQDGKIIAVLFHTDEIPLGYKMLSNEQFFKNGLTFFRMKDPQKTVMEKFQVTGFPFLIIMTNAQKKQGQKQQQLSKQQKQQGKRSLNLQIAHFTGKFNYDELTRFFSYFMQKPQPKKQTNTDTRQIIEIKSQKLFTRKCVEQLCYLLLVNGDQASKQKRQQTIKEFRKIGNRISPTQNLAYIDAVCHSEILGKLQIQEDQLPTVIYLNSKFQKFSRLIGRIQQKSLLNLIARVKANKIAYRTYQNLKFQKKDCTQVHAELQKMKSGSALTDQDAQILQQIRKQQEEKRKRIEEQLGDNTKEKKNKKKRKRRPKQQQQSEQL